MNWKRLFPLIFLFTCVDGFISNYFYPAKLPYLFKDILILIAYLFFMTQEFKHHWINKFKNSIGPGQWYLALLFMLIGAIQIFNPGVPNIIVGFLGFKIAFFYWPLAILAYAYIDGVGSARKLFKAIVYFSIPICLFGIYQFWVDPDFMVRVFGPGFGRAVIMAHIEGAVGREETFLRVFSTFASTGQFSAFLVINAMLIFGLLFTAKKRFEQFFMTGCALLNFIAMLATGARGGVLFLVAVSFVFIFISRLWRSLITILLLGASIYLGFHYLGKNVIHRYESITGTSLIKTRTIDYTSATFLDYFEKYPLGNGMGTASDASKHVIGEEEAVNVSFVENYLAKLQCETGILGVITFYLFLLCFSVHWIRNWLKRVDKDAFMLISSLTSYCLVMLSLGAFFGILDSPPAAVFLWALIGITAKLSDLQSLNEKDLVST